MGINLAGPSDWNSELPFVDVFRQSRKWISQRKGAGFGKGPSLDLDEFGWVTRLQPDCFAESLVLTDLDGHYPKGPYVVLYEGTGRVEIGHGTVLERSPHRLVVEPHDRAGMTLQIHETDPHDPVRNIRVVMPGFEEIYQANPWHPLFLDRWKNFAVLRFMDFMHTNNSHVTSWDQRPRNEDQTFSGQGVSLKMMLDPANRLEIDPWFCMPHAADDDYVRAFALVVRDQLDPSLKVYVEYSNEVWNSQFEQHRYAAAQGKSRGFAESDWEAAWHFYAHRSTEVFRIWEQVFGGADRLVRVLSSQAGNPYVAEKILGWQNAAEQADALAIAPYLGMNIPGDEADAVAALGVDGVLDRLEQQVLPRTIEKLMRGNKSVADQFGLPLIAYEAGQHLVGLRGGENDRPLTETFHAANLHPRMGEIYRRYYQAWDEVGGGVMACFSSVSKWSKWGSWGLMQYHDLPIEDQPKMKITLETAEAWKHAAVDDVEPR